MIKAWRPITGYTGIRALVIGASGFIGRWVAAAVSAAGADVFLFVRDKQFAERIMEKYNIRGNAIELDLRDTKKTRSLFHMIKPTITFNLAGYGVDFTERDEETAYDINANLVSRLCEIVGSARNPRWMGQDIVHVGSALEYGEVDEKLFEDAEPRPTTTYGKSKLAGTVALKSNCKELGIKGLTARLFTVYGPGEHQGRLLPALLDAAREGKTLELTTGIQKRDFTFVMDVADGLLRLGQVRAAPGEIVNLATGKLISVRNFGETAANILGIPGDRLLFGAKPMRVEEMQHSEVPVERLRQLVSWVPPTEIVEGIRITQEFEENQG